jgi:hypothetical protein
MSAAEDRIRIELESAPSRAELDKALRTLRQASERWPELTEPTRDVVIALALRILVSVARTSLDRLEN